MNPAQFQLRHAETSDLDLIVALERVTEHAPHWTPAAYWLILNSAEVQRCLIVATTHDALVGFAVGLIHPSCDSDLRTAELESVVVQANARRAGIGRTLCNAVIDWCRVLHATEVILEVRALSRGAIALYAGLGLVRTGIRGKYYRNPDDDALMMRLQLGLTDSPQPSKEAAGNDSAGIGIAGSMFTPRAEG
jgi:ribosomal-protein-alanine N-acetyltransferase